MTIAGEANSETEGKDSISTSRHKVSQSEGSYYRQVQTESPDHSDPKIESDVVAQHEVHSLAQKNLFAILMMCRLHTVCAREALFEAGHAVLLGQSHLSCVFAEEGEEAEDQHQILG